MANLNINTSDDAALRQYARQLGINNWHNMNMSNLRDRIAEAEAKATELTPAPELSQPTLTQPDEQIIPEVEPVESTKPVAPKQKSIDEMTDAEVIAAAEAEKARQFLRDSQKKQAQNAAVNGAKVNMEHLINEVAPRVKINVPFQEGKPLVRVAVVNGVRWDIPVGEDMEVPLPIAEALNDCMRDEFANYKKFKKGERAFLDKKNVIFK